MENVNSISRRNFLAGAGAAAAAAGLIAGNAFADEAAATTAAPKYIFLFIGDGMGNEQVQVTSFFKGATENDGAVVASPMNFMGFPHTGSVTTYDSTSFCPDSASTATSIATGYKTQSGTINMDPETLSTPYETIAEKLHSQKEWKIGVISTVNMNHATPAAFYAHQASRNSYYEIGEELVACWLRVLRRRRASCPRPARTRTRPTSCRSPLTPATPWSTPRPTPRPSRLARATS